MLNRPLIAVLQFLLNDERIQYNPDRVCRMPVGHKLLGIGILRHQFCQLYPCIGLVQLAIVEYKVLDLHLPVVQ